MFDNAYEGLCDFEVSKEEQQLPIDEIKNNLRNIEREPLKNIGKIKSSELSWRNPLASQVISSEEEMESVKYMQKSLPNSVKTTCEEFVLNYDDGTMETPPQKLSHVNWTEREEALKDISVKILAKNILHLNVLVRCYDLQSAEVPIAKLEHNDKNIATENDELKSRVAKLEQQQLQNNSSDNIDTPEQINLQSDESKTRGYATYTPVSDVSDISSNSVDLNDTPNSDVSFEDKKSNF
ncbi:6653_t:CDS:2 [Entrophospora sp. SA101]|nr:6653_t:CDS:2 [Entrophospora sp. SA101]